MHLDQSSNDYLSYQYHGNGFCWQRACAGDIPGGVWGGKGHGLSLREGSQSLARSSRSECSPLWTGSRGWPAPRGAPGCSWRPRWSEKWRSKAVRGTALSDREAKRMTKRTRHVLQWPLSGCFWCPALWLPSHYSGIEKEKRKSYCITLTHSVASITIFQLK